MYKIQTIALRQAEKSKNLPPYGVSLRKKVSHAELCKTSYYHQSFHFFIGNKPTS